MHDGSDMAPVVLKSENKLSLLSPGQIFTIAFCSLTEIARR